MVIPMIFLAFMLSAADFGEKIRGDAAFVIEDISGKKQDFQHMTFHDSRAPRNLNDTKDQREGGKKTRISLEIQAGAGIPAEDYLDTHAVSGFGVTIPLKKRLLLCLDLGYWKSAVEGVPTKFYDGHLKAFPFLASLQFSPSHQSRVNPYAFLGGGYIISSFSMKDIITIPEITIEQSVKNGLCLRAGLGIGIPISSSWGVFTEAAYFYSEATGVTTIIDLNFGTSTREFPVNLHAWIFQIGIKYFIE